MALQLRVTLSQRKLPHAKLRLKVLCSSHVRSALVAILTLPLGVFAALIVMRAQGLNANIMSLGGIAIAIGAMVDAAVVMIENAHKRIEQWEHGHGGERLVGELARQLLGRRGRRLERAHAVVLGGGGGAPREEALEAVVDQRHHGREAATAEAFGQRRAERRVGRRDVDRRRRHPAVRRLVGGAHHRRPTSLQVATHNT